MYTQQIVLDFIPMRHSEMVINRVAYKNIIYLIHHATIIHRGSHIIHGSHHRPCHSVWRPSWGPTWGATHPLVRIVERLVGRHHAPRSAWPTHRRSAWSAHVLWRSAHTTLVGVAVTRIIVLIWGSTLLVLKQKKMYLRHFSYSNGQKSVKISYSYFSEKIYRLILIQNKENSLNKSFL